MNQYRIRSTGQVVSENEFRAMHLDVSFPAVIDAATLSAFDADPVMEGPQAVVTDIYHYSQAAGVEKVGDVWMTKYIAGPVFSDSVVDGVTTTAADQEAAYKDRIDSERKAANKSTASALLTATDYLTTPDASSAISNMAEILAYRAAVREIAINPPVSVDTWPVRPVTVWTITAQV